MPNASGNVNPTESPSYPDAARVLAQSIEFDPSARNAQATAQGSGVKYIFRCPVPTPDTTLGIRGQERSSSDGGTNEFQGQTSCFRRLCHRAREAIPERGRGVAANRNSPEHNLAGKCIVHRSNRLPPPGWPGLLQAKGRRSKKLQADVGQSATRLLFQRLA